MIFSKTAGVVISEMKMLRANGQSGAFALVEGPDDLRFWKMHLKVPRECIVVADGVINLRGCMQALPVDLLGSVVAIADKDYENFLNPSPFASCVDTFFYDEGFLETFIINTVALRKILRLHADDVRLERFLASHPGVTIYSHLRRIAAVFGRLRVLNSRMGLGACFSKTFTPYRYVCSRSWILDEPRLLTDFSTAVGWTAQQLQSAMQALPKGSSVQLSHGHDIIKILVIGLKAPIGSASVGEDSISKELAIAFEGAALKHKRLYQNLNLWAGARRLI
ncbi:hypothetical protein GTP41_20050 [Pseudoduganella sp. DS3]|uniref:DUF4435 domain-containing protein n=1 Tax=Pseudoduganella guangdongensis TaxID=2692179 RepID=A0A6N9HM00_9BURK|nr:hypothetical protein [Pseudoduganella guangdongensis]MYN04389.1 hypothetical protein [Pseudoduganella guangdongensis]